MRKLLLIPLLISTVILGGCGWSTGGCGGSVCGATYTPAVSSCSTCGTYVPASTCCTATPTCSTCGYGGYGYSYGGGWY